MYDDDFGTYENEPYQDDLQEFSDREAWEDMVAERDSDFDSDFDGSFEDYAEDRYLDSYHEGLTDLGDFGDY